MIGASTHGRFAINVASSLDQNAGGASRFSILWILDFDYSVGLRHGATMRYVHLARELTTLGNTVHFAVTNHPWVHREERNHYLDKLHTEGHLAGYHVFAPYECSRWRRWVGKLALYPGVANALLRRARQSLTAGLVNLMAEQGLNAVLVSDRYYLPMLSQLSAAAPTLVDWGDSMTLTLLRGVRVRPARVLSALKDLVDIAPQELFWPRHADANMAVSPVDAAFLGRMNRRPDKAFVVYNGIDAWTTPEYGDSREPGRLIFTGNMSFPPNYDAAIWFIDRVLPRLRAARSDIRFVVAGQNPVEELMRRVSPHVEVLGYCPDLQAEIARSQLFVAPMVSGSGFKNKVLEALETGTYVACTRIGAEFLPERLKEKLLVSGSAKEMAGQILSYLDKPSEFAPRLREAHEIVRDQFAWNKSAQAIVNILGKVSARRAP